MQSELSQALSDLVKELSDRNLRYAVIGGVAMSMRGRVRATEDVDLIIDGNREEAMELFASLPTEIFGSLVSDTASVVQAARILPLKHLKTQVGLDLAIGESGLEQQILARATDVAVGSYAFRVATAEDLILMKLLAGRAKDLDDVNALAKSKGKSLDWNYCIATARQLDEALATDLAQTLEHIQAQLPS